MAEDKSSGLHEEIRRHCTGLLDEPGALLPVLHRVQAIYGCISSAAVAAVARLLNLSRAEVHGVVTFYHDFRQTPSGQHVIKICQAEACQAMGANALTQHASERLGVALHETSANAKFTLEPVYCLGACACSPALMIDNTLHARVSPERFDALLQQFASQPREANT